MGRTSNQRANQQRLDLYVLEIAEAVGIVVRPIRRSSGPIDRWAIVEGDTLGGEHNVVQSRAQGRIQARLVFIVQRSVHTSEP